MATTSAKQDGFSCVRSRRRPPDSTTPASPLRSSSGAAVRRMQLRTSHSRASFTLLAPPVWCRSPSRSGWRFTPMVERHGLSGAVPAFLTTSSRAQMRAVRTFRVGSCIHRRNVRSMLPTLTPRLRRRVELIRSKHVCTGTPLLMLLRRIRRRSPAEIAIPHRRRNVWSRDEKKAPREIGGLFLSF